MLIIPPDIQTQYDIQLQKIVPNEKYHTYYRMWLRGYLAFCQKSGMPEKQQESIDRFVLSLAEQGRASFQQKQAAHAVSIYLGLQGANAAGDKRRENELSGWDKVFEDLFTAIRTRHYSRATLKTYTTWIRHFKGFTKDKDPAALDPADVKAFLRYLAVERHVAASTQNQAFNALLFLFKYILSKDFGDHRDTVRAKSKPYIPVVLSRPEVTPSPPISSRRTTISARSRRSWATRTCGPR